MEREVTMVPPMPIEEYYHSNHVFEVSFGKTLS